MEICIILLTLFRNLLLQAEEERIVACEKAFNSLLKVQTDSNDDQYVSIKYEPTLR